MIEASQLRQKLPGATEFFQHVRNCNLQLGGIRQALPFEDAAKKVNTIFVGGFGQLQIQAGFVINRPERSIHFGRQCQRHSDGFALRPRKFLQMFFGETLEQALPV